MGDRRQFRIPLGWETNHSPERHYIERLGSNTEVIPLSGMPDLPYTVERIPGSWSPHIPEKTPRYNVWSHRKLWSPARAQAIDAVRLSQVPRGRFVLVNLPAQRRQWCANNKGLWHGVLYASHDMVHAHTYCEQEVYFGLRDDLVRERWTQRVPDCPECAKFGSAWVCLRVYPYEDKQEVVKKTDKEAAAAKRRARMPTAYDRLLVDDLFETPGAYKPEVVKPPQPEPEPFSEFERQERDRKLESARERSLRLKQAIRERKAR